RRGSLVFIRVVEVETGARVSFEIPVEAVKETIAILGRVRWMPDGKSLVFLGQDERGVHGLYIQDFVPGQDPGTCGVSLDPLISTTLLNRSASRLTASTSPSPRGNSSSASW